MTARFLLKKYAILNLFFNDYTEQPGQLRGLITAYDGAFQFALSFGKPYAVQSAIGKIDSLQRRFKKLCLDKAAPRQLNLLYPAGGEEGLGQIAVFQPRKAG